MNTLPLFTYLHRHRWIFATVTFLITSGVALYFYISSPGITWFNHHMSRDLARTLDWMSGNPENWRGPEIGVRTGAQLPGPVFYWFLGLLSLVSPTVLTLLALKSALSWLGGVAFTVFLSRKIGKLDAFVFFLFFSLFPPHLFMTRTLWNPSVIVLINLGLFYCTYKNLKNFSRLNYFAFHTLAFAGLSFHMSIFVAYLAGIGVMCLQPPQGAQRRVHLFGLLGVILGSTLIFVTDQPTVPYVRFGGGIPNAPLFSIQAFHGLIQLVQFHLSLKINPIQDYDLFGFLMKVLQSLQPEKAQFLDQWSSYFSIFDFLFLLSYLFYAFTLILRRGQFWKKMNTMEQFTFLTLSIGFIGVRLYMNRPENIPFRYGYLLHPFQFLLPVLMIHRISRWTKLSTHWRLGIRGAFLLFAILTFIFNAFFTLEIRKVMSLAGRSFHVQGDSYEIPLEYKIKLFELAGAQVVQGKPLWTYLHGAIPNKVFSSEYEEGYLPYFGGLERYLKLHSKNVPGTQIHYRIESLNWQNPRQFYADRPETSPPYKISPLPQGDLPKKVELHFYKAGETESIPFVLEQGAALNQPLLLPQSANAQRLVVRVQFGPGQSKWLRTLFDYSHSAKLLTLQKVELEGKPGILPGKSTGIAEWLAQSEVVVRLPDSIRDHWIRLEFKVEVPKTAGPGEHPGRLDIFRTDDGQLWNDPS